MAEESDAWARGAWIWDAAVYGLLGLATLAALLDGVAPGVRLALPAIAAVFGVCYWWSARRYIGEEQRPPASVLPLLGLLVALWCLLTWLHPAYFLLLFGLYPALYRSLPLRWAIGAALGLTVLVVAIQLARSGGSFADNWYVLVNGAITAVLGVLFAVWVSGIIDQSHERKRLIEQLEATRSELAAAEREAGRLGERQRLAREIHDTLTQGYVSIVLLLQAAEGELPPGADEARRRLALAARTARENLAEARRLVWELRPAALRAASLGEAVGRLAERLAE